MTIPVIDVFAGAGGLGEGFASLSVDRNKPFHVSLSIEKEPAAHQTLELRAFFRKFEEGRAPEEYYEFLRNPEKMSREQLFGKYTKQADAARRETWNVTLGSGDASDTEINDQIRTVIAGHKHWVLTGGPPCQAYSTAGRSRNRSIKGYSLANDSRHALYTKYLRIIASHWPPVFVMENVKGLLNSRITVQTGTKTEKKSVFLKMIEDLSDPQSVYDSMKVKTLQSRHTYRILSLVKPSELDMFGVPIHINSFKDYIVESERYGIPQRRHRVILLGVRDDIQVEHECLEPSQEDPVTVSDVLGGLPRLRSGFSSGEEDVERWLKYLRSIPGERWFRDETEDDLQEVILEQLGKLEPPKFDRGRHFVKCSRVSINHPSLREWYLDRRIKGVCNFDTRSHMERDLHRYFFASCFALARKRSPGLGDFPESLWPEHRNVTKSLGHDNFTDRFRVQLEDEPSTTVMSHLHKDGHYYIHHDPTQCRSLTVREAARLQTFPDNYFFFGNRSQQYIQVGNAVPPLLSQKIAGVVYKLFQKADGKSDDRQAFA